MGITEIQIDDVTLNRGLEPNALNFQLLDKTIGHALDHVMDERAAQTVQGLGLRVLTRAADYDLAVLDLQARAPRQFPVQFALRSFDMNFLTFDLHFHL